MIDFFEITKRALNGPYYTEKDFDMKVLVPKVREVVDKYDLHYDPENPIPDDDQLADDVFQAGLELYSAVGTYCTDTSRVIQLTKEEILEGLRDAPAAPVFGEGSDRGTLVGRRPESDSHPPGASWARAGPRAATRTSMSDWLRGMGAIRWLIPSPAPIWPPSVA